MHLVPAEKKPRPTVALALIVKNEEQALQGCIDSVRGVDEVVIVDTGSTDGTKAIAEANGARFIEAFSWTDPNFLDIDFGAARTRSMRECKSDWIICMDADERMDKGHIQNVIHAVKEYHADETKDCLKVILYNEADPQEWFNPKIFRNREDIVYVGEIHERALREGGKTLLRSKTLENVRIRYEKRNPGMRNMNIIRNVIINKPGAANDLWWQRIAAREYAAIHDAVSSIWWYERYLETYRREGHNMPEDLADTYFQIAYQYFSMRQFGKAKESALAALGVNADFKEAAGLLADVALMEGNELNRRIWTDLFNKAENRGLISRRRTDAQ